MKIGQTIKFLRQRKGIRQNVFCKKIGLSQTALSQIEGNIKCPHYSTLYIISETLDIPMQIIYLLSIMESDVPKSKKKMYKILYPKIKELIYTLIDN